MPLLLLFIAVPLIEIALFIQLGSVLDLGWILLIVVLTAILGTWLVKQQGRGILRQLQGSLDSLNDPTEPLVHGAMILFSGALLLTPGFFTDAIGFLLLVPAVRVAAFRWLRPRLAARAHVHMQTGQAQARPSSPGQRSDIIDGDYKDVTPPPAGSGRPSRPSGWTKH